MASEAHDNVKKAMDAAREQELAAYIMRDVDLRQKAAQEGGVLAYARKPIPRSKPNNRFLQNTLKSVDFANRTARENEMWEKWNPKRRTSESGSEDRSRKRHRDCMRRPSSGSDYSSDVSSQSSSESEGQKPDIEKRLQAGKARGRGSTGPRADETGPFLFPTDEQERQEYELLRLTRKPTAGPACPEWIRGSSEQESQPQRVTISELLSREPLNVEKKAKKDAKRKKKSKKLRKEKKKRRKKLP